MNIELLESRIAPALVVAANHLSATFTDADGDLVTIKASKPILDDTDFIRVASEIGEQLQVIDFSDDDAGMVSGVNLKITATPHDPNPDDADTTKRGDGLVNIGYLNATGRDLGAIKIAGDLGEISAGSGSTLVPAVKGLSVGSMGEYRVSTGAASLTSQIAGTLGSLKVKGDLHGATVQTLAGGKMNAVRIGGSIVGIGADGQLISAGDMGTVKIAGDLIGGASFGGFFLPSGYISSGGALKSISIGGSISAERITGSGAISSAGPLGSVQIGGDVNSGTISSGSTIASVLLGGSLRSGRIGGQIYAAGKISSVVINGDLDGSGVAPSGASIYTTGGADIGNVTIGGSMVGGSGANSARISTGGNLGMVKVGHNIQGGLGNDGAAIFASGTIGGVTIGGSLIGGVDADENAAPVTGERAGSISSGTGIGFIKIAGDLQGGSGHQSGAIFYTGGIAIPIAGVTIGGSVRGGSVVLSGTISGGVIGPVKIGGDVAGGLGNYSGRMEGLTSIASITIGGSLIGGNDSDSSDGFVGGASTGVISAGLLGPVKIGGSVVGGNTLDTGAIQSGSDITSLTIGGSLIGGAPTSDFAPDRTGSISAGGAIGKVKIGGDIRGSDQWVEAGSPSDTGSIRAGRIASLTVGGSIVQGSDNVVRSGSIHADFDIGAIRVKGNLIGTLITAVGQETPGATDVAIKSLTVGGNVDNVRIGLGYDKNEQGKNADAQIGAVKVAGDWIASFIIAGVNPDDGQVGDSNDFKLSGAGIRDNAVHSKIASITIGGQVRAIPGTNNVFGFAAEQIGSFKYNGIVVPLTAGASNDTFALGAAQAVGPSISTTDADGFAVHVFEV